MPTTWKVYMKSTNFTEKYNWQNLIILPRNEKENGKSDYCVSNKEMESIIKSLLTKGFWKIVAPAWFSSSFQK
jgi:hypothetical protein